MKVDGLIRLMEGENTGPINIGNPGCFPTLLLEGHVVRFKYQYAIDVIRPNLVSFLAILGEFTMIELAETVKEVRAYLLRNSFDEQSS